MKTTSVSRIALMALALAVASPTAFAQTTTTSAAVPTAPAAAHKHADAGLTTDEKAHLEKVRTEALAANPSLKAEADNLKVQHQALKAQGTASADTKQALKALKKDHEQKLQTAMLKIDPTVAPILAKIKAAHKDKKNA